MPKPYHRKPKNLTKFAISVFLQPNFIQMKDKTTTETQFFKHINDSVLT